MKNSRELIKDMGFRISTRRKQLGLTQETLAELADVSPQLISNAENGERAISSDKLYRISRALNTSADYLLCGEVNEYDKAFSLNDLNKKLKTASPDKIEMINQIADIVIK